MLQQYTEYAETVDEVNDLGAAYDNLQNPDTRPSSPFRKIMSKCSNIIYSETFLICTLRKTVIC